MFCFSAKPTFQASKHISTIEKLWKMQQILTQTNNKNICHNMHTKSQEGSLTEKNSRFRQEQKGFHSLIARSFIKSI